MRCRDNGCARPAETAEGSAADAEASRGAPSGRKEPKTVGSAREGPRAAVSWWVPVGGEPGGPPGHALPVAAAV